MKQGSFNLSVLNGLVLGAIAIVLIAFNYLTTITAAAVIPVATIGVFFGVFASVLVALLFWDALTAPTAAPVGDLNIAWGS